MKNQVIEVIDREHGRKVIEYWKSRGVDTMGMCGSFTKEDGEHSCYYGVINEMFDCCTIEDVRKYNAEIIELPKEENSFPRVMLVSNGGGNEWRKRVVFMKKCNRYLAWNKAETIEESEDVYEATAWRYAKDIPNKVIISKAEIAEKFGVPFDYIKIVD